MKFTGQALTRESDGADAFEGGGAGGTTNLSILNRTATTLDIASSSGADATVPAATTSLAGVMTATDKAKLDGIGSGANVTSVAGKTGAVALAPADIVGLGEFIDDEVASLFVAGANITLTYDDAANTLTISSTGGGGGGGVTSVSGTGTVSGLTLSGTVTSSGNITLGGTLSVVPSNFASQTANTFLAAPNGAAGAPTFRAIVAADIPTLNQSTTGSAATLTTSRAITMTGDVSWTVSFNGGAAVSAAGTIQNAAVTYAKIQDVAANSVLARAAATSGAVGAVALSNSQLFGRGATGDLAPITLGTNLSMSGTTLNATGGGGGGLTNNWTATSAPTASNDGTQGYAVGSQWLWAARGITWVCLDATTGAAVWRLVSDLFPGLSGGRPSFSWDSRPAYEISGANQLFGGRWTGTSGSGGSFVLATLAADGVILRRGTSGTSGFSRVQGPNTSNGVLKAEAGTRYEHEATIFFPSAAAIAPDATNTWGFTCGFNGAVLGNDTPGQNFAMFHWRWNGTAAEFVARRRRANGTIVATALTAPPADGELRLRTVVNGQTSVEFWVNGVLQVTDTTNMPLSTAVLLETVDVFHQAGTADRGVNLRRHSLRISA